MGICKNCKFFRLKIGTGTKQGMCTIRAPQLSVTPIPQQGPGGTINISWQMVGAWPPVAEDGSDSCGEYQPSLNS